MMWIQHLILLVFLLSAAHSNLDSSLSDLCSKDSVSIIWKVIGRFYGVNRNYFFKLHTIF